MASWPLERLIFVDETGAKTNMIRRYGRAQGGQRVLDDAPHGHWNTTTLLSALRGDGSTTSMLIDSPTDGDVFLAYVQQVLAPTLRPGDLVVLDNLASHKTAAVRQAIPATGALLCPLPPYSPDLNPIEKMWAKIKAYLRKVKARTQETLEQAVREALALVDASNAIGWIASCGYNVHT